MLPATSSPPLTWWLWYHQLCWRNGILSRQGQSLRDALCTEPLFCDHLVQNTMSRSRVALVRPRGNKRSSNFWVWCWMEELPTYIDELLIFVHAPVLNPSIISTNGMFWKRGLFLSKLTKAGSVVTFHPWFVRSCLQGWEDGSRWVPSNIQGLHHYKLQPRWGIGPLWPGRLSHQPCLTEKKRLGWMTRMDEYIYI